MSEDLPNEEPIDRSNWPARVGKLHDDVDEVGAHAHLTPSQRIDRVDESTIHAWTVLTGSSVMPAFRRDVVRILRGPDRWLHTNG